MLAALVSLIGLMVTMQGFALLKIDRIRELVAGHAERITALETYHGVEHPSREAQVHG